MAVVKRKIMSKGELLAFMYEEFNRNTSNEPPKSDEDYRAHMLKREAVPGDVMAHFLNDGKDVKIFYDGEMDSLVVKYDDGKKS